MKRRITAVVFCILLFFYFFNCIQKERKKEVFVITSNKIDKSFFSYNRVKTKDINDIDSSTYLTIQSINVLENNIIRLLFNKPVFYEDEIGKSMNRSFITINPLLRGVFFPRTSRILDFIPDNIDEKKYTLKIPRGLIGIEGNKLFEEYKSRINFDLEKISRKTSFPQDDKSISKDKTDQDDRSYENIFSSHLRTVIDLETPYKNSFEISNMSTMERSYKKIQIEDIPFILSNKDTTNKIKEYFIRKNLLSLEKIKEVENENFQYIPDRSRGLFFCYQKIIYKDNKKKEFFQILNFTDSKLIGFDTENSVLLYGMFSNIKNKDKKLHIYNKDGIYITNGIVDKNDFLKIPNRNYSDIYVYFENFKNFLYKIKLNNIEKKYFNIFANYDLKNQENITIYGIVSKRNGLIIDDLSNIKMKIILKNGNQNVLTKTINQISNKGKFFINLNLSSIRSENINVLFSINNKITKEYKLDLSNKPLEYNEKKDMFSIKPLSLFDSIIFNNAPLKLKVNGNFLNSIDSVFYTIKKDDIQYDEQIYNEKIQNEIRIKLPRHSGEYTIHLQNLLKNGDSIEQTFTIKKINRSSIKNNIFIINNDHLNIYNDNITFDLNNPFTKNRSLLVLYNNDTYFHKHFELKEGINKISIDKNEILSPNMKAVIFIYDLEMYNKIYYITDLSKINNVMKDLKAKISQTNNLIKVETNLDQKKFTGKDVYIQYTNLESQPAKYIFDDLYYYNDLLSSKEKINILNKGTFRTINNDFSNLIELSPPGVKNYRIDLSLLNSNDRIYNSYKSILKKSKVDITYLGPEVVKSTDEPKYSIKINNLTFKDLGLDVKLSSRNGQIKPNNSSIFINSWQSENIDFEILNINKILPVDMIFEVSNNGSLMNKIIKRIYFEDETINNSLEINGNLYEDRISSSYIKIPNSSTNKYNIEIFISGNKYINLLKNPALINGFDLDIFEILLLKYLNNYIRNKLQNLETEPLNINKFIQKDKGIKQNPEDNKIDIDSTLLGLLTTKFMPEFYIGEPNKIITNIISKDKKKIINSPLRVFILSELGFFFNEINKNFLERVHKESTSIFYYNYYKRLNIPIKISQNIIKEIQFKEHSLSEVIYPLLNIYFYKGDYDITHLNISNKVIENIISKLIFIKNWSRPRNSNERSFIKFESDKLGNFESTINNNDLIYKKYIFQFNESIKDKDNLIEYTIEKRSDANIYYLIISEYMSQWPFVDKNDVLDIYSEWINEDGNTLNNRDIQLSKGQTYFVNSYIISENNKYNVLLKPIKSSSFSLDKNNILLNGLSCKMCGQNEQFIYISKLKKGINLITYPITPRSSGKYMVSGNRIIDLYDLDNNIAETDFNIIIN